MEKIVSLFVRNYAGDRRVIDEVVPGAEWVPAGEGVPTLKLDGTSCLLDETRRLFKRYDAKAGRPVPSEFRPAQPSADPVTGHWPGWLPIGEVPEDRWHREALADLLRESAVPPADGTYELVGPKVQGNPDCWSRHTLIRHGSVLLLDVPRDFDGLRTYLDAPLEGVVWHHPDGRMVKIKGKDFGIRRPPMGAFVVTRMDPDGAVGFRRVDVHGGCGV